MPSPTTPKEFALLFPPSSSSPTSAASNSNCINQFQWLLGRFRFCLLFGLFLLILFYFCIIFCPATERAEFFANNYTENNALMEKLNKILEAERRNDWTRMCAANITRPEFDRLFPPWDQSGPKYVLASWGGLCGGLGNQLWRFASLYGISRPFGRRPIYTEDQRCLKEHGAHETENEHEIERLFPVYSSQLKFIKVNPNQTRQVPGFESPFGQFTDPQSVKFSTFKEKYVQLDGYYFQSYKFFESRRQQIRQLFQFSAEVCSNVSEYGQALFGDDQSHKLCVHTRIEDFAQFGFGTSKEFTEKAIPFAHRHLTTKLGQIPVSVVLLGVEKPFLANLTIDRALFPNVYLPKPMPRGHDLCFGTTVCDSLLITASSSTFSWWMAYLMPDAATIFYDSDLDHTPYKRINFLPEWTPIRLQNGTIIYD